MRSFSTTKSKGRKTAMPEQPRPANPEHDAPLIDVRVGGLFWRLPAKLRPSGYTDQSAWDEHGRHQQAYDTAFDTVHARWWANVPDRLAKQHLSAAFSTVPGFSTETKQVGTNKGWLQVEIPRNRFYWTSAQKLAWIAFQAAIVRSLIAAEKEYHREVAKNLGLSNGPKPRAGRSTKTKTSKGRRLPK